jgi:hypothetical protein
MDRLTARDEAWRISHAFSHTPPIRHVTTTPPFSTPSLSSSQALEVSLQRAAVWTGVSQPDLLRRCCLLPYVPSSSTHSMRALQLSVAEHSSRPANHTSCTTPAGSPTSSPRCSPAAARLCAMRTRPPLQRTRPPLRTHFTTC